MPNDWSYSPQPSRSENGHSTKEIEHRFTAIEEFAKESKEDRSELHEIVAHHTAKLSTHEKAILAICIAIATLLQDKLPSLAKLLLKGGT